MKKNIKDKTVQIAGILIILGILVGIFSIVPVVEGDYYLEEVYPNRDQVRVGALFQFLLVPLYIGFALLLYPFLNAYNASLAIGFVGFRIIAGVFQLIGVILLPIFIVLSGIYLDPPNADLLFFETLGDLLTSFRDLTNHLGVMLATGLGNLLLYYTFYKGKYVPVWLSLWGVVGNLLLMLGSFLLLFQVIEVVSLGYGLLTLPLVIQEVALAIWLLTKGLHLEAVNYAD